MGDFSGRITVADPARKWWCTGVDTFPSNLFEISVLEKDYCENVELSWLRKVIIFEGCFCYFSVDAVGDSSAREIKALLKLLCEEFKELCYIDCYLFLNSFSSSNSASKNEIPFISCLLLFSLFLEIIAISIPSLQLYFLSEPMKNPALDSFSVSSSIIDS